MVNVKSGKKIADARTSGNSRLGETMSDPENILLINKLKAACVDAHLAFINADHATRPDCNDAYVKAKSAYDKALAD